MNRVHVVLLWHMHQPQYRDPETGRYVLAWTRLHALKDYWGMVAMLKEFPKFHATFNVVPALGMQLEEFGRREVRRRAIQCDDVVEVFLEKRLDQDAIRGAFGHHKDATLTQSFRRRRFRGFRHPRRY